MGAWRSNRWQMSSGYELLNQDLLTELGGGGVLGRRRGRLQCVYVWVRIGDFGNESANELAEEGRLKNPGRIK